jgi:predicted metalloprotease
MHNVQEFENHNSAVVLLETMYVLSSPVLLKKENVFIENKEKKRQKRYVKLLRKHLKGFPAVVSAC